MLFVLQLLQLAAKRLMMRLAIQQLGKHDRVPPLLVAACGKLGMEERSHTDSGNPNTTEAGLSQHQLFHSFRDTIWPPWQKWRNRQGAAPRQPTFPRFSFLLFSESRIRAEPTRTELWSNMHQALWKYSTFWHFYCLLVDSWVSATDWIHVPVKKNNTETEPWNMFILFKKKSELFLQQHTEEMILTM